MNYRVRLPEKKERGGNRGIVFFYPWDASPWERPASCTPAFGARRGTHAPPPEGRRPRYSDPRTNPSFQRRPQIDMGSVLKLPLSVLKFRVRGGETGVLADLGPETKEARGIIFFFKC